MRPHCLYLLGTLEKQLSYMHTVTWKMSKISWTEGMKEPEWFIIFKVCTRMIYHFQSEIELLWWHTCTRHCSIFPLQNERHPCNWDGVISKKLSSQSVAFSDLRRYWEFWSDLNISIRRNLCKDNCCLSANI